MFVPVYEYVFAFASAGIVRTGHVGQIAAWTNFSIVAGVFHIDRDWGAKVI